MDTPSGRSRSHANSCQGKSSYVTRKEAKAAADRTRKRGRFPGADKVRPYHCTNCGLYHVGRKPAAKQRLHQRGVDPGS